MTTSPGGRAGIRAFDEADLGQVARIWDTVFRPGSSLASRDTAGFLRRTLLSDPWHDPELPSLVYAQQDGQVIAFLGSSVRRMRFDGRSIRAVSSAHFMIDPASSVQGVGALLLGRLLAGPQELTTTDTANAATQLLWRRFGGRPAHLSGVGWVRVFRPSSVARHVLAERGGKARWFLRAPATPLWRLADVVLRRAVDLASPSRLQGSPTAGSTEPLSATAAPAELEPVWEGFRLRPEYEAAHFEALHEDLSRFGKGVPVAAVVRRGDRTLGAYVYLLEPGGVCPVLAIVCAEGDAPAVVSSLFDHASSHEAAALVGRVEPHAQESLNQSGAQFFAAEVRRLLHSRDPDLLATIDSGSASMTRLDGEWW
ncbi:MAG TPA: hypothetical protein VGK62_06910 [Gaiellaceae bacterium]